MSSEPATKMWSGRFREPLNKQFEEWQRSFPFDCRLLHTEVRASIAHARMIQAAGILTSEEGDRMVAGLNAISLLGVSRATLNDPNASFAASAQQAEDIHHFVELELTNQIGDLALKLHTGRSRNEQIATDMRLFVRDAIDNTLRRHAASGASPSSNSRKRRRSRHALLHAPPACRTRACSPLAAHLCQHDRARHQPPQRLQASA